MPGVCIIFPADPFNVAPSGIDTFIDGLIRWSPPNVEMRLVGISMDPVKRPVGRWNRCALGGRSVLFYPVLAHPSKGERPLVPVALRFMLKLMIAKPEIDSEILEFHRIEPLAAFLRDPRQKVCFIHQNMADLRNPKADIRWKHAPALYFALEKFMIPKLSRVFCVREDAAQAYRERYPSYADRFEFTPTWVDPEVFSPAAPETRGRLRAALAAEAGLSPRDELLVSVGRLDHQKDPLLLLQAFALLAKRRPAARLVFIGDGVLREDLQRLIRRESLSHAVRLAGLKPRPQIADWLRAADLFVMSSAYEGMPMAVLEALGSGLPVVSTAVGEVGRVVKTGVNGEVVDGREPASLAAAIERSLAVRERYAGFPCTSAVAQYSPRELVSRIYGYYRDVLLRPGGSRRSQALPTE